MIGKYEELADEYYNASRHPTCANFYNASLLAAEQWVSGYLPHVEIACEVGCGRSALAELLVGNPSIAERLVLLDSSPSMLRYSMRYQTGRTRLILADAEELPFGPQSINALLSSLGDSYNTPQFWSEVKRVLRRDGIGLFTTPSSTWVQIFRDDIPTKTYAEFELRDDQKICVPSKVYSSEEQKQLIAAHDLIVKDVVEVPLSALRSSVISPKLLTAYGYDLPVVTGFIFSAA